MKLLDVMLLHAMLGERLIFGARTAVVGVGPDADAATRGEDACHLDVFGIHQTDEVLHDDVDAILMEVAMVAEGEEIELQTLGFHHTHIGDVADADLCKVGLAGDGAEAGELGTVETDPIVVVGVLVDKGLKDFGGVVALVLCAAAVAKKLEAFVFAIAHGGKDVKKDGLNVGCQEGLSWRINGCKSTKKSAKLQNFAEKNTIGQILEMCF